MHSKTCSHLRDTHPRTLADGRVITVTGCCRCGMEWIEPKEKPMKPVRPKKRWVYAAMAALWLGLAALYIVGGDVPRGVAWHVVHWGFLTVALAFAASNIWAWVTHAERVHEYEARHDADMSRLFGHKEN